MTRPLKPHRICAVLNAGITVDVMFDRNNHKFFAELNEERVEAASAQECKQLAHAMIPRATKLVWQPVIAVAGGLGNDYGRRRMTQASIKLEYERYEVATRPDGRKLKRDFQEDSDDACVHQYSLWEDEVELPYSEETWAAVQTLARIITDAGKRLEDIVKDRTKLLAALASGTGLALLPEAIPTRKKARR